MSDNLTSLNVKVRVPVQWTQVLDAFAEALELPYGSRAAAVRFCVESALPMLQAMTEAAQAARQSPAEFQKRIADLSRLMERDVAEFRKQEKKLRVVSGVSRRRADRPPLTGGSAHG